MAKVLDKPTPVGREAKSNGSAPHLPERLDSDAPSTPEAALKEVRTLVEASKVRLARERCAHFLEIWPDDERLQAADRVLGPPRKLPQRSDLPYIPRDREFQWIREHGLEYSGQWVALLGDRVLASGTDFKAIQSELKTIEGGSSALLHFQPSGPWIR